MLLPNASELPERLGEARTSACVVPAAFPVE